MTVIYKRRREGKTNYAKRLALLKSKKNRVVARLSNLYLNVQYVEHKANGDNTKFAMLSKELKEFGWKKGFRNLPVCYLTGYLFSKETEKLKLPKEVILDLGLQNSFAGGRIYACVKGMKDAGLNVAVSEEAFPTEDRIKGKHINAEKEFEAVLSAINSKYKVTE